MNEWKTHKKRSEIPQVTGLSLLDSDSSLVRSHLVAFHFQLPQVTVGLKRPKSMKLPWFSYDDDNPHQGYISYQHLPECLCYKLGCGVRKMWAFTRQGGSNKKTSLVALWEMTEPLTHTTEVLKVSMSSFCNFDHSILICLLWVLKLYRSATLNHWSTHLKLGFYVFNWDFPLIWKSPWISI